LLIKAHKAEYMASATFNNKLGNNTRQTSIYSLANRSMTKYLHESYRTMKNDIEVHKHSKQRKTSVHDESRTIVHIHKQKITDDKDKITEGVTGKVTRS